MRLRLLLKKYLRPHSYYKNRARRQFFYTAEAWYMHAQKTGNLELKRCAEDFIDRSLYF